MHAVDEAGDLRRGFKFRVKASRATFSFKLRCIISHRRGRVIMDHSTHHAERINKAAFNFVDGFGGKLWGSDGLASKQGLTWICYELGIRMIADGGK